MKKILITGGSGFIASHIADQLTKNGHDVYILDKKYSKYINKKQKMIVGNIDNQKLLKNIFRKIEIIDLDGLKHVGTLTKVSKTSFEINWKERQAKKIGKGKTTVALSKNFNYGEYKKAQIILN